MKKRRKCMAFLLRLALISSLLCRSNVIAEGNFAMGAEGNEGIEPTAESSSGENIQNDNGARPFAPDAHTTADVSSAGENNVSTNEDTVLYQDDSGNILTGNEEFVIDGSGVLTAYNGTATSVVIPSNVKIIGDDVFKSKEITSVVLNDGLQEIGSGAFEGCKLTALDIPASVRIIGGNAFMGYTTDSENNHVPANQITSLVLHEGLEDIGSLAFVGNKIEQLTVPGTVKSIGAWAFGENELKTLVFKSGSLQLIDENAFVENHITSSIEIPETVTEIGLCAFSGTLDESLNKIGNMIPSITLHEGIQKIGDYAFSYNEIASPLTIPSTVTSLGFGSFSFNLIPSLSILTNHLTKLEGGVFSENRISNAITLPETISEIGSNAFSNNQIPSITLSNSVTKIDSGAFSNNMLTSLSIPDSITDIPSYAFNNNKIASLTLPSVLKTIGERAFQVNCLTELELPSTLSSIGICAFCNNDKLNTVVIPKSVNLLDVWSYTDAQNVVNKGFPFSYSNNLLHFVYQVYHNSYAEQWCIENNVDFTYVDELDITADSKLTTIKYLAMSKLAYADLDSFIGKSVAQIMLSTGGKNLDKTNTEIYKYNGNKLYGSDTVKYYQLYMAEIPNWIVKKTYHNANGLYAVGFYHPGSNIGVLSFRGSQKMETDKYDWSDNLTYGLADEVSNQMYSALVAYRDFKKVMSETGSTLAPYVTGHSLGGGLAVTCSTVDGALGESFDSSPTLHSLFVNPMLFDVGASFSGTDQLFTSNRMVVDHSDEADYLVGRVDSGYRYTVLHSNENKSLADLSNTSCAANVDPNSIYIDEGISLIASCAYADGQLFLNNHDLGSILAHDTTNNVFSLTA